MSIKDQVPESHHDLLDAPGTAAFVTIDAKGRPQTTAVWYLVDEDGVLKTSVTDLRQKYKNISGNPEVDFFFIDPANPFHTLEVRGTAELIADPDFEFVHRITAKYDASADDIIALGGVRYTVVVTPRRIVTNG